MFNVGDVISYLDMCHEEGGNLQQGMNFRLRNNLSVILMSLRPDAPYADRVEENGRVLIYEGHDAPRKAGGPNPKTIDQPRRHPSGKPTQNGLFYQAAMSHKRSGMEPELVKVYEKVRRGNWTYNGIFKLVDAWQEESDNRQVFKFKLELTNRSTSGNGMTISHSEIDHNRIIPASVKVDVWKRDKGRCVLCGSRDNLHFDHIIPYSKGGSSLVAENIQLLCARHNLAKRDKIE
jgi:hypothetical protein